MRRHARAVFLLGGWLLMTPPYVNRNGERVYNTDAPIIQWKQISAFDTAQACEFQTADQASGSHGSDHTSWVLARCVPSEAIYPPKQ